MNSTQEVDRSLPSGLDRTPAESAATLQCAPGLDELAAPDPVSPTDEGPSLEQRQPRLPDTSRLHELGAPSPAKHDGSPSRGSDLEDARDEKRPRSQPQSRPQPQPQPKQTAGNGASLSQFYTLSYLVWFAIFGTLARLGLQAITIYPGAPVALGELWANVAGTLLIGFLAEDRLLFRRDLLPATQRARKRHDDHTEAKAGDVPPDGAGDAALKKEHMAIKKSIPAYIGLSVGFCGSFTTFSSFMRDAFLALSDDLDTSTTSTRATTAASRPRNAGYSVEALLAVLILEAAASLAALSFGAHLALFAERYLSRRPPASDRRRDSTASATRTVRPVLDPLIALLAWPAWLGAVFLAIWPPHPVWRGRAVFALVFAPAGCLLRFYLSAWLNARLPRFPLGTFAANALGTLVLGMCWDLQRSSASAASGLVGCQVLQGVMDGFCGCLSTVSTWALELKTLRRGHAYVYGALSLAVGVSLLVVVMGSLRWTVGFAEARCGA